MTFTPTHRVVSDEAPLPKWSQVQFLSKGRQIHSEYVTATGRHVGLADYEVESLEQGSPVTELIPNKRYRVTLEGTFHPATPEDGPSFFQFGGLPGGPAFLSEDDLSWGTVELLPDPLPTTPTSIIRHPELGKKYMKLAPEAENDWVREDGFFFTDETMGFDIVAYTVEFDAGTE